MEDISIFVKQHSYVGKIQTSDRNYRQNNEFSTIFTFPLRLSE